MKRSRFRQSSRERERFCEKGTFYGSAQLFCLRKRAGVQPWEALVVENAPLGVRSGVAAGVFTVAVNTGPIPPKVLADEGADLVLPSMAALDAAWDELHATLV